MEEEASHGCSSPSWTEWTQSRSCDGEEHSSTLWEYYCSQQSDSSLRETGETAWRTQEEEASHTTEDTQRKKNDRWLLAGSSSSAFTTKSTAAMTALEGARLHRLSPWKRVGKVAEMDGWMGSATSAVVLDSRLTFAEIPSASAVPTTTAGMADENMSSHDATLGTQTERVVLLDYLVHGGRKSRGKGMSANLEDVRVTPHFASNGAETGNAATDTINTSSTRIERGGRKRGGHKTTREEYDADADDEDGDDDEEGENVRPNPGSNSRRWLSLLPGVTRRGGGRHRSLSTPTSSPPHSTSAHSEVVSDDLFLVRVMRERTHTFIPAPAPPIATASGSGSSQESDDAIQDRDREKEKTSPQARLDECQKTRCSVTVSPWREVVYRTCLSSSVSSTNNNTPYPHGASPPALYDHAMFSCGPLVFLHGGRDAQGRVQYALHAYHLARRTWIPVSPEQFCGVAPPRFCGHAAAALNTKKSSHVLVGVRYEATGLADYLSYRSRAQSRAGAPGSRGLSVYQLDLSEKRWTECSTAADQHGPGPRYHFSLRAIRPNPNTATARQGVDAPMSEEEVEEDRLSDEVLLVGGERPNLKGARNRGRPLLDVWHLDLRTGIWREVEYQSVPQAPGGVPLLLQRLPALVRSYWTNRRHRGESAQEDPPYHIFCLQTIPSTGHESSSTAGGGGGGGLMAPSSKEVAKLSSSSGTGSGPIVDDGDHPAGDPCCTKTVAPSPRSSTQEEYEGGSVIGMSRKPVASQQATTGLATCNDDGGADAAATARSLPLRLVMERDRVLVLLLQTRPQSRYVRALPILKQVQEKTRLRLVPLQPNQLRFQSTTSSSSSAALSTAAAAVAGFPALDRNTLLLGASSSSSSFLWSTSQPSYANYYAPPSQSSGHSRFNLLLGGGAQREESMRDPFVGGSSTQTSGDGGGGGGDDDVGLSMDHNVLPGVLGASAPSLFAFVENQKVFVTILQNGTVCAYDSES